jgi:hypothetical protein
MLVIFYAPLRLGNTQKGHPRWLQNAAQMRRAAASVTAICCPDALLADALRA